MGFYSKVFFMGTAAGLFLLPAAYAQGSGYDKLVSQAQADLNAGNAAKALVESQQAIKAAPTRWEAYVVAGGALQLQHQYDHAIADYSQAVEYAPEAKKAAVRALMQKTESEQAGTQPNSQSTTASTPAAGKDTNTASSSGPTYSETIQWIQKQIGQVGLLATNVSYTANTFVCTSRDAFGACTDGQNVTNGLNTNSADSGIHFQFAVDGCNSMTISESNEEIATMRDADPNAFGNGTTKFGWMMQFKIPIGSIRNIDVGTTTPPDYRDHSHPIGAVDTLPPLSPTRKLYIVIKDNSATRSFTQVSSDTGSSTNSDKLTADADDEAVTPDGTLPAVNIWFGMPGNDDLAPHFKNALDHLVELCKDHPEQAPKQPF